MERPSYENQGHTPMEQRRVDSKTPRVVRTARDRVEVYRRERNRAWDLADAGHFDEALAILTDLKEEYLDREELVTELELIEEETREAQQAARQAKRRRIFGYVIGGAAVLGILVLGYLWLG